MISEHSNADSCVCIQCREWGLLPQRGQFCFVFPRSAIIWVLACTVQVKISDITENWQPEEEDRSKVLPCSFCSTLQKWLWLSVREAKKSPTPHTDTHQTTKPPIPPLQTPSCVQLLLICGTWVKVSPMATVSSEGERKAKQWALAAPTCLTSSGCLGVAREEECLCTGIVVFCSDQTVTFVEMYNLKALYLQLQFALYFCDEISFIFVDLRLPRRWQCGTDTAVLWGAVLGCHEVSCCNVGLPSLLHSGEALANITLVLFSTKLLVWAYLILSISNGKLIALLPGGVCIGYTAVQYLDKQQNQN